MSEASDEQLMTAVQKGDLDMLQGLFERYQKRIYNYFLKSTMASDESADLTQNTFIRVMKYRQSYKEGSRFEIWLFQIARNMVKDHFRKQQVHNDRFAVMEVIPDKEDDSTVEQRDREKILMQAMEQLSPDKRELLAMTKFDGMKYEKVAAIKGVTVSAIKVQVHRAIKDLRTIYFKVQE